MTKFLSFLLGIAVLTSSQAAAQQSMGGQLQLQIARNFDDSDIFKRIAGAFDIGLSESVSLQFDIAAAKYTATDSTAPSAGVHLTYRVSPSVTAGAFFAAEDQLGANLYAYGLELGYAGDWFSAQGYMASIEEINLNLGGTRYGLDAEFGVFDSSRFSVLAGAHGQSLNGADQSYVYFGAEFTSKAGAQYALTLGQNDQSESIAALSATFSFGSGAKFNARDGRTAFPGY